MPAIDLRFGDTAIPIEFDDSRFDILHGAEIGPPLSDLEIGERLDNPIDSPPLEDIAAAGDSVLIVVPDATRQTAAGQIVNLIVRRLLANGTAGHDIRIIFATGIHRPVTEAEKAAILTPFIAQRIKTVDHDPRDLMRLMNFGTTSGGIDITLNRALTEHDHVVIVGGVTFHYFAGFTGGRKLICPGLASARTISATHKLAFDLDLKRRRDGVDTGRLDGNAVHGAFMEVVEARPPAFAVNAIVNDAGEAVDLYCGDWRSSHQAACDAYAAANMVHVEEKRGLVVVSCGGYPHDINMIQAHKSLDAASRACSAGGTIILLAECREGLGREDFLNWFDAADSRLLAERICEKYQVNGQTAWSLLEKAERFDIRIVTDLSPDVTAKMRLKKIALAEISRLMKNSTSGYVIPVGSKLAVSV
jgi:nickel-dependent lactate racemase